MRYINTLIIGCLVGFCLFVAPVMAGKIAIVIDDIGYKSTDQKLLEMDAQLTYAVLPHTPMGTEYAKFAAEKNRDVIIHLPMQAQAKNRLLGPGALTSQMSKQQFKQTLISALEDIPFAIGINNHMGSKLTQEYSPMAWTMRYLKEHNLMFIDSVTSEHSKARKLARHFGVPSLSRHLFLDNKLDQSYISGQFAQLVREAKKYKRVVAIAHPHPETVEALSYLLPQLAVHDIELVGVSKLLPRTLQFTSGTSAE